MKAGKLPQQNGKGFKDKKDNLNTLHMDVQHWKELTNRIEWGPFTREGCNALEGECFLECSDHA